ncbi:MAG: hypothetical protein ABJJ53_12505 [Sulfitobacter sp.]
MNTPHGSVLFSVIALPVLCLLLGAAFGLGRLYEAHRYEGHCHDLGGGQNPTGYPICVLPEAPKG